MHLHVRTAGTAELAREQAQALHRTWGQGLHSAGAPAAPLLPLCCCCRRRRRPPPLLPLPACRRPPALLASPPAPPTLQLEPLERAQAHLALAHAAHSLLQLYLRASGVDPDAHAAAGKEGVRLLAKRPLAARCALLPLLCLSSQASGALQNSSAL